MGNTRKLVLLLAVLIIARMGVDALETTRLLARKLRLQRQDTSVKVSYIT